MGIQNKNCQFNFLYGGATILFLNFEWKNPMILLYVIN